MLIRPPCANPLRRPARKMANIAPFHVMDILGRAREQETKGQRIIHMEVGEPDFPTPAPIVAAGQRALEEGNIHYTAPLGLPALREAIARFYRTHYEVDVPARRIVVTPGASMSLQLALGVLIDLGDDVLVTDPGYPCNRNMVRLFGGNPVPLPVGIETNYQPTRMLVSCCATPTTSAIVLTTPSNPTGGVVSLSMMAGILEEARHLNAALVVDEIYLGLVYDSVAQALGTDALGREWKAAGRPYPGTAAALSDEIFVIDGFSKYFGMTGWRLGWMIVPEPFLKDVEKLAQNLYLSAPTVAQHAALAAFEPETLAILEERRRAFEHRRDFLLPALRDLGFSVARPDGAFYLYVDCSRFAEDSLVFANGLLEQVGVAITPGIDFGDNAPERYVRFAYTTCLDDLREGVERIRRYLSV
uniref:Aminotransferase n=1 Tax=Candidatus Kentrum sp. MB TaxID=2138164 RepID=A0A450WYY9_9GAMM|nr:MAG: Aspartate/methionine/tyrosine aminotransferase [Candidatus Kentron sp. MB]VFK32630.1 MAG: Aspartate/methionine/tyrosine aminotransferase [Candidatus Kentron sp. MB]VFK76006.1 MAG: Aspartate/methionine/tyrosine aminotransferase [Candidatus Kentron sp. MB]